MVCAGQNIIRKDLSFMKLNIKYFDGATPLKINKKGNWIDVYAAEDVFIPVGVSHRIRLGFALELPEGYEAHLAPRSSTFDKWGIILANHVGVIDTSYCGDNDEWLFNAICLKPSSVNSNDGLITPQGTFIHKGDKIGQFRIMRSQEPIEFNTVEHLENADRGGFGTTGSN